MGVMMGVMMGLMKGLLMCFYSLSSRNLYCLLYCLLYYCLLYYCLLGSLYSFAVRLCSGHEHHASHRGLFQRRRILPAQGQQPRPLGFVQRRCECGRERRLQLFLTHVLPGPEEGGTTPHPPQHRQHHVSRPWLGAKWAVDGIAMSDNCCIFDDASLTLVVFLRCFFVACWT